MKLNIFKFIRKNLEIKRKKKNQNNYKMKDECENCFKSFADNADCVPVCKCGNVIHKSCIDKWLSLQDSTCSDCKQRLDLKEIVDRLLFSEDDGEKDLEKCELREEKQTKEILSRSRQVCIKS
jgi:hypothetical protein